VYDQFGKRAIDVIAAGVALALVSPLLMVCSMLIWLADRKSPIFKQTRIGRDQQTFTILKLRSMKVGTSDVTSTEVADLVITPIGRFLRRTNIDELPQLINIVRGEMSIVGPRPALRSQVELLKIRSSGKSVYLRPGLTGLAQLRAYDGMPESEKGAHDNEYAERVTFTHDATIVAKTLGYLMKPPPRY